MSFPSPTVASKHNQSHTSCTKSTNSQVRNRGYPAQEAFPVIDGRIPPGQTVCVTHKFCLNGRFFIRLPFRPIFIFLYAHTAHCLSGRVNGKFMYCFPGKMAILSRVIQASFECMTCTQCSVFSTYPKNKT